MLVYNERPDVLVTHTALREVLSEEPVVTHVGTAAGGGVHLSYLLVRVEFALVDDFLKLPLLPAVEEVDVVFRAAVAELVLASGTLVFANGEEELDLRDAVIEAGGAGTSHAPVDGVRHMISVVVCVPQLDSVPAGRCRQGNVQMVAVPVRKVQPGYRLAILHAPGIVAALGEHVPRRSPAVSGGGNDAESRRKFFGARQGTVVPPVVGCERGGYAVVYRIDASPADLVDGWMPI